MPDENIWYIDIRNEHKKCPHLHKMLLGKTIYTICLYPELEDQYHGLCKNNHCNVDNCPIKKVIRQLETEGFVPNYQI